MLIDVTVLVDHFLDHFYRWRHLRSVQDVLNHQEVVDHVSLEPVIIDFDGTFLKVPLRTVDGSHQVNSDCS